MNCRIQGALFGIAVGMIAASMPASAAAAVENEKFALNCVACHGVDLHGIPGLGINLVTSGFVGGTSVPELVAFLKTGRSPGIHGSAPMPAFAWLPDADLADIATYIKGKHDARRRLDHSL
ncbi:MAG: cytochrome c [Gammaproteobacteria bacterium]